MLAQHQQLEQQERPAPEQRQLSQRAGMLLEQVRTPTSSPTEEIPVLRRSRRLENAEFVSLYNMNHRRPPTPDPPTPQRAKLHLRGPKSPPPSKTKSRALASSRSLKPMPKTRRSSKKRTQPSATPPAPIKRKRARALPYRAPEADIQLNFGMSEPTFGYLTTDISACLTPSSFWDHAAIGSDILNSDDVRTKNAGAIVDIQGVMLPVVVPWRSTEGWEKLMGVLDRTRYGKRGRLEVYVDCVMNI